MSGLLQPSQAEGATWSQTPHQEQGRGSAQEQVQAGLRKEEKRGQHQGPVQVQVGFRK